ncbi:MAG: glycosyltransferase family 2 protein, partial [Dehalococcoidia bacterium]
MVRWRGWTPLVRGPGPGPEPPGIQTSGEGPVAERLSGISAFFPCYNDAGSIEEMVRRADTVLPAVADRYDITVVDDGSSDNSVAVLEGLRSEIPALSIVRHKRNRGYGGALRSGFEAATKEFVFYTDGDGQYDPRELPKLVALMTESVGLVNGYKMNRADAFYRTITGGTYEWMARRFFGIRIRDVDCDFRLIRTEYLRRVPLTFESGAIGLELVYNLQAAGCRMRETPVHHYPRLHGRSEFFSLKHVTDLITDVARFWWHTRRRGAARVPSSEFRVPSGS